MIPPLKVICWKNGVKVEREVASIEKGIPGIRRPVIHPQLFQGEEVSHTADGQIHIFDVNHSPFEDENHG